MPAMDSIGMQSYRAGTCRPNQQGVTFAGPLTCHSDGISSEVLPVRSVVGGQLLPLLLFIRMIGSILVGRRDALHDGESCSKKRGDTESDGSQTLWTPSRTATLLSTSASMNSTRTRG
jgi:hypothetical protein